MNFVIIILKKMPYKGDSRFLCGVVLINFGKEDSNDCTGNVQAYERKSRVSPCDNGRGSAESEGNAAVPG